MGSTRTLVTLLRLWIRRFTMIISAWWLEQAAISVDKNSKKSTGTLDQRKLLSRCGFLQSRSIRRNEKCADRPISLRLTLSGDRRINMRYNNNNSRLLFSVELMAKTKKKVLAKNSRLFSVQLVAKSKNAKNSKNKVRIISAVYCCISIIEKTKRL